MRCCPSNLIIICKGRILSRQPKSTLQELGVADALGEKGSCKLVVLQRLSAPTWPRLQVCILGQTIKPLTLRMHASSPIINVKRQIREKLRIPNLAFSLHTVDGELLHDDLSLRDLRIPDGGRLFCRIRAEDPAVAVDADQEEQAAAAVRELIRQIESGPNATRAPSSGSKRRRGSEGATLDVGGGAPDRRPAGFLGMRRGFLLAGPPAAPPAPPPTAVSNTGPLDASESTTAARAAGYSEEQRATGIGLAPAREARASHSPSGVHFTPC